MGSKIVSSTSSSKVPKVIEEKNRDFEPQILKENPKNSNKRLLRVVNQNQQPSSNRSYNRDRRNIATNNKLQGPGAHFFKEDGSQVRQSGFFCCSSSEREDGMQTVSCTIF